MDAPLRRAAVQALILLRNRGQLDPAALLPLLFRLFRVNDKALRALLLRHIVAGAFFLSVGVWLLLIGEGGGVPVDHTMS